MIKTIALIYGALFMFLARTNPRELSASWLVIPFILVFLALLSSYLLWKLHFATRQEAISRVISTGVVIAGVPTVFMVLLSLGQLQVKDILLLGVLSAVALFYSRRLLLLSRRV